MTQTSDQETGAQTGIENHLAKHGKVSYMEIPAVDTGVSAAFYQKVFAWKITGDERHRSFSDSTGEMIGAFESSRDISSDPGILPYIYVKGIDGVVAQIKANGGQIVREVYPEGGLFVATFRDPAGNVMGIWQQGPR